MNVDRIVYATLATLAALSIFGFWAMRQLDRADYTPREAGR